MEWTEEDVVDELAYIAEAERCGCGSCLSFAEGWRERLAVVLDARRA